MTRPRAASEGFVSRLPDAVRAQVTPVYSPLIDIVPLAPADAVGPYDCAVFTSRNGVQAGPEGNERTAYCIGAATTQAAQARGWAAQQVGQDADSLVAHLEQNTPQRPLVHLSGVHTRGDITARLTQAGLTIRNIAVYDQTLRPLSTQALQVIETGPRVLVPLFSPRTAAHFAQCTPGFGTLHVIALSPAVAAALPPDAAGTRTIAARPDAQAMGVALAQALCGN